MSNLKKDKKDNANEIQDNYQYQTISKKDQ